MTKAILGSLISLIFAGAAHAIPKVESHENNFGSLYVIDRNQDGAQIELLLYRSDLNVKLVYFEAQGEEVSCADKPALPLKWPNPYRGIYEVSLPSNSSLKVKACFYDSSGVIDDELTISL